MTSSTTHESPPAQLAAALATLLSATMDTEHVDGQPHLTASAHGRSFTISVAEGGTAPAESSDPTDRYLAGLTGGDTVRRSVHEDHFRQRRGEGCGAGHSGYRCTRKPGHTGVHVATMSSGDLCCDPWPNAGSGAEDEKALWRGVKRGSELTSAQAAQMARSYSEQCDRMCVDHDFSCLRKRGHDGPCVATYGRHVGADVCCVPYNKPWAPMRDGLRRFQNADPTGGPDEHNPCGYDIDGDKCTRGVNHPDDHISGNGEWVLDARPQ